MLRLTSSHLQVHVTLRTENWRAIANILYGVVEIPETIARVSKKEGGKAGWSYGVVEGTHKAYKRLGYGFYELFTFRCPTYKGPLNHPTKSVVWTTALKWTRPRAFQSFHQNSGQTLTTSLVLRIGSSGPGQFNFRSKHLTNGVLFYCLKHPTCSIS